jgi:hypothetical protein
MRVFRVNEGLLLGFMGLHKTCVDLSVEPKARRVRSGRFNDSAAREWIICQQLFVGRACCEKQMKRHEQLRTERKMNKKTRKKLMTDVCEDSS